jgi:hypothetical protein
MYEFADEATLISAGLSFEGATMRGKSSMAFDT